MSGIVSARSLPPGERIQADVVIVGSGAGGAVVAAELASAGQRVVVLEEGPHVTPERYATLRPSESIRHMWRDGAMTVAWGVGDSPMVNVTMGRCIGGSSALTGGVCFRVPESVASVWAEERGLAELGPAHLYPYYTEIERAVHVEEVPAEMRSRGTQLFAEGGRKKGFTLKPLRRNTKGCQGCGRCNFGCPKGAKLSVDVVFLPRAVERGAAVYADALVERVRMRGDRAVGVEGSVLGANRRRIGPLRVDARRVVLAAGAFHTPLILRRSRLAKRNRQVGRNLTLHPAFRMLARFDDPVRGWRGALQSAYTDAFEDERITLVGLFVPPSVIGATMPGFGPDHTRRAAQISHLAMFGGLLHDEGGGVVRRGLGREPLVTYRMSAADRAAIPRILSLMTETFLAAGAREVFLPILGQAPLDATAISRVDFSRVPSRKLECASQHPLGSCRMGTAPEHSVVDVDGRVWGTDQLYIADGSVVPTSLGVNPQLTVMSLALRTARVMLEHPLPN